MLESKSMNIQGIVEEIKRGNKDEKRRIKERIGQAIEEVERLKEDFLKIDPNMERMILFGSLGEGRIESVDFDIDIAVKSDKYYRLTGRALESDFKVDVVDLDSVHKIIKKNIIENGKVVYEKR